MGKLLNKINNSPRSLLQVALDFISLDDALKVLNSILNYELDIIEFGTPLIKVEGLKTLGNIARKLPPDVIKLADTKTADVGGIEVSAAKIFGFDVITVLASADDEVIKEALIRAQEYDMDVVVDTVGIAFDRISSRIEDLLKLGVKIVNIHVGIDVQRKLGIKASDLLEIIKELTSTFEGSIKFSVSGGIKPSEVCKFVDAGASIIVIGSAITKAPNPLQEYLKALNNLKSCTS